jgi:hypothetical protein
VNHPHAPAGHPLPGRRGARRLLCLVALSVSAVLAQGCEDPPLPQEIQDYREAQDPNNCQPTEDPTEICDGLDNDCDGLIDTDDKGLTRPSCDREDRAQGVCEDVTRPDDHCLGTGGWKTEPCTDDDFAAEVGDDFEPTETSLTDGLDNDCDGVTDAPSVITPPDASVPKDTTTPTDTAGPTDVTGDTTDPGDTQSPECSGDGDCDPSEVNTHFVSCIQGLCVEQACAPNSWNNDKEEPGCEYECTSQLVFLCDEVDDDCDGITETPDTVALYTCETQDGCPGTDKYICDPSGDELKMCEPDTPEPCEVTNNFGTCTGSDICAGGGVTCSAPTPEAEICDGQDNDCDGSTDQDAEGEPLTQSCYSGPEETKDVGQCLSGTATCQGSNWGECVGEVLPTGESCDGQDEDCDDAVDEGFVDTDADGVCDGFDEDIDGDGVANDGDTCPLVPNPVQAYQHDDPSVCCGCPAEPEGLHEAFACVDGGCVPIRCIATHYDDPDTEGLDCQARPELWVDGVDGSDIKTGLSEGQALRSIAKALEIAQPWTLIRVKPATYDEGVTLNIRGLRIQGEGGAATLTYPANWGHNVVVTTSDVTLGPDLIIRPATVGVAIGTVSGDPLTPNVRVEGVVIESLIPQPFDSQTSWVAGIQAYHSPKLVIEGVTIQGLDASGVVDPGGMKVTGIELSNCDDVTIEDVAISALFGATGGMTGGITVSASEGLTLSSVEVSGLTAHEDGHAVGVDLYNQSGAITFTDLRISGLVGGSQSVPAGEPLVDMGAAIGIDLSTGTESSTDPIVMRNIHLSGLQAGAISDATSPVYAAGIRVDTNRPLAIRHLLIGGIHAQGGGHSAEQINGALIGVDIQRAFNSIIEQAVFDDIGAGLTENAGRAVVVSDQGVTEDVIIKNSIVHRVRGVAFEVTTSSGKGGILVRNGLIGPVRPWHYAYHYGEATYGDDVEFLDTQWWVDPHFIDPGGADFRLLPSSPAIDAGTGGLAPFTDEGTPDLHHCWEPQHNGGAVNIGLYGNTAEATVRPGAPMGAGCTSDDAPPFFHSPGCAEDAYVGDAVDGASCGCFNSGVTDEALDVLGADCYGSLGQCDAEPGVVLCEESLNATACSAEVEGEPAYAGGSPGCGYGDANCDGEPDSTDCGACLNTDDQDLIADGLQGDPAWLASGWFDDQGCLQEACDAGNCNVLGCADVGGPLTDACEGCLTVHAYCILNSGCSEACWTNGLDGMTSPECRACTQGALCDLSRDKCAFVGPEGVHPCETLCDMVVDSGCVEGAGYETCLADCTPLATIDDPNLDTVTCRIARLEDGESCEAVEPLCADLDKDGQNPHMGDCNEDDITIYAGAPELCDGLANQCQDYVDTGADCGDDICLGAAGCVAGDPCQQIVFGKVNAGTPPQPFYESGLTLPEGLNLDGASEATIAGWVRQHAGSGSGPYFRTPWLMLDGVNGTFHARLRQDDGLLGCQAELAGSAAGNLVGGPDNISFPAKLLPPAHQWAFVAVTWDGEHLRAWHNGVLASSQDFSGGLPTLESGCEGGGTVGHYLDGEGLYVGGNASIRHVSVWHTALDPATQLDVAQGQLPIEGLVAYYPMDEGGGAVAQDVAGQNLHGTYLEGTTWLDAEGQVSWMAAAAACPLLDALDCIDGVTSPLCDDEDEDGFTTLAGDCDDAEVAIHRGAPALCDGLKNDCLAETLEPEADLCAAGQVCAAGLGCLDEAPCGPFTCWGGQQCDALVFGVDGDTRGAVALAPADHLYPPSLSMTMWVRVTAPGDVALATAPSWALALGEEGLTARVTTCEGEVVGETPPVPLSLDVWHHLALVHGEGEGTRLYVDGVLASANPSTTQGLESCPTDAFYHGAGTIWLGGRQDWQLFADGYDTASHLQGQMRHVTLWSTPLGAEAVAQVANGVVGPPHLDDLLGWYTLTTSPPDYNHGTLRDRGPYDHPGEWTGGWYFQPVTTPPCPDSTPACAADQGDTPHPACADGDGDGWAPLEGDCDDDDELRSPDLSPDLCDGIDSDCDGYIDNDWSLECPMHSACLGGAGCAMGEACQAYVFGSEDHDPDDGVDEPIHDGGIDLPPLALTPGDPMTVAAWVMQTGWTIDMTPVISTPTLRLSYAPAGARAQLFHGPCDQLTHVEVAPAYGLVPDHGVVVVSGHTWHFMAATWDGVTLRAWVNGMEVAAFSPDSALFFSPECDQQWAIGYAQLPSEPEPDHADAAIRHASIWSRALSGEELTGLAVGTAPSEGGLEGYWPMDEEANPEVADVSGHGRHGTLVGAPAWLDATTTEGEVARCQPTATLGCAGDEADWPVYCTDADEDGVSILQGDCDEGAEEGEARFPGNPEICDGIDNDCDGVRDGTLAATGVTQAWPECGVGEVCLGRAGCVSATPSCNEMVSDFFGDGDHFDFPSGVNGIESLDLGGKTQVTISGWVSRLGQILPSTPIIDTPWIRVAQYHTGYLNAVVHVDTPAEGCVPATLGNDDDGSIWLTTTAGCQDCPHSLMGGVLSEAPNTKLQAATHIAVTWDGATAAVWVNGILAQEHTIGDGGLALDPECDGEIRLGYGLDAAGEYVYSGSTLSHVSVFDRALDSDELIALAQGNLPPDDLLAYWPLDEADNNVARDLVGGHHGTYLEGTGRLDDIEDLEDWNLDSFYPDIKRACLPDNKLGCTGEVEEQAPYCLDVDKDGFTTLTGDCDDVSAEAGELAPDKEEVCDGIDNDCDGWIDRALDAPENQAFTPLECSAAEAICLGTLGCVSGTSPCAQALFGRANAVDNTTAESGIDVSADLGLDGAEAFTVGAWVRQTDWSWHAGPVLATPWFFFGVHDDSNVQVRLRLEDGEPGCTAEWDPIGAPFEAPRPHAPRYGWAYIALSWDGKTLNAYINGLLSETVTLADAPTPLESGCSGDSTIGYHLEVPDEGGEAVYEGADAVIRHLSVWRTALDPDAQLELAQGHVPEGELLAYWPVDEGSGALARDASVHGHHGAYLETTEWFDGATVDGLDEPASCPPADTLSCANGTSDPLCKDADEDDFTVLEGDCDDESAGFNPGHWEGCDVDDQDCDGDYYDPDEPCGEGTFCAAGMKCTAMESCVALHFEGDEAAWYRAPDAAAFKPDKVLTLAAWIRPEAPPKGRAVQGIIDHDAMYGLALGLDGRLEARVRLPAADGSCGEAQPWFTVTSLPGTIPLDTWSWVAASFDGSTLRIYRDAVEVGANTVHPALEELEGGGHLNDTCEGSGVDLGRRGSEGGFVGQIRQASFLGGVLGNSSLTKLGKGQLDTPAILSLVAHWPMTGPGLTDVLVDYSPGQHHAQRVTVDYEASAFFTESCQLLGPSSIGGDLVHCSEAMSWFDAREACIGLGGDLASIHTGGDSALIAEAVNAASPCWIGLNDLTEEDNFVWSDGSPFDHNDWADDEPNNTATAEDCALVLMGGLWNDGLCSSGWGFACRIPPTAVAPEWTSRDDCPVSQVLGPASGACAKAGGGGSIVLCATDNDCGDAACVGGNCQAHLCVDGDGDGWLPMAGDCDDDDSHVHATHIESCNGVDDDCDGVTDPGSTCCGNGEIDGVDEVCDDGNTKDEDACSADCSRIGYPLAYYDMEEGTGGTIANKSLRTLDLFPGTLHGDTYFQATGNPGAASTWPSTETGTGSLSTRGGLRAIRMSGWTLHGSRSRGG